MKPIGLFKRGGRVAKVSFLRSQMKPCLFFEVLFKALCKNTMVKFFLVWVMQTFLSSKMPQNSLEEKFCSRVLYREQIMHHG